MSKNTLKNLFLFLFSISYSFNLSAQCTTPPTLLINGKAINQVQYSGGPQTFIRASDFDVGSYSNCGSLVAFSFSPNVNDTLRGFDCSVVGTQIVTIFLTDTEGNQTITITYVTVQENLELCSSSGMVNCPNEFIVRNGLTTALSNTGSMVIHADNFVDRILENCTGTPTVNFEGFNTDSRTLDMFNLGTNLMALDLQIDGSSANKVNTFMIVQSALSTTSCIPVPITHDGITTALGPTGTVTVLASAFDVASYSDCGGDVKLSYSSNSNDTLRTLDAGNFGTHFVEIWITDTQTGTQNKLGAYILIQDLIPPICAALPTVFDTCNNYEAGVLGTSTDMNGNGAFDASEYTPLSGALLSVYNNNFGAPSCADNTDGAASLSIEQQYQLIETACAILIRRRYRAVDLGGNTSAWTEQHIEYFNFPDWQITFSANSQISCTDEPPIAGIDIQTGNCHSFSTNIADTVDANLFYRTKRTFYITNECHNFAGKDTLIIPNNADGIQINSTGNENVGCIIYEQYLDITDGSAPQLTIISPDPCISGQDFDAAPFNEEDISPGNAPYECDQIKTWSAQAFDDCDDAVDISGKLFIDDNLIFEFEGASVDFVVAPNVTYTVQFSAVDDYGNTGFSSQENTFFDCVQPIVQLRGNKTYTLPASGSLDITVFDFDYSSFDNCTDQSNLAFRIWHGSLGGSAPTTLSEIQALPTALTFDVTNIGTNLIWIYVVDEAGNWSYAQTFAILNDANNCNTTPFDLPVTINNYSNVDVGTNTWSAMANFAVSPVSWTGKLYEDEVLVAEVDTNFLTYTTLAAKDYKVVFNAMDACNNIGTDTLTQNFSDCNQAPFVRLVDGLTFNLPNNGTVNLLSFQLDNGSFDNCTSSDKFDARIWHASLGEFPQNISEVNALGRLMTFDCNLLGTQVVHIFIIDEMGNYASASTFVIIQDNNGVCFFPPPPNPCSETPLNLTGTLSTDSTYQAVATITSTATVSANTDVTFQAGQNITLNTDFHAVAGSMFHAKIEACATASSSFMEDDIEAQTKIEEVKPVLLTESVSAGKPEMDLKVYPNPFQGQTTVDYFLPTAGNISLQLRDFLGRKVKILENNNQKEKGWYQLQLDAAQISAGTYYLVLMNNGQLKTNKLVIIK